MPVEIIPCAYCHRLTPPEHQATPPWYWPHRGVVTNCVDCSGFASELAEGAAVGIAVRAPAPPADVLPGTHPLAELPGQDPCVQASAWQV